MSRFTPLFMLLLFVISTPVSAALEYIQYTLSDQSIQMVEAPTDGQAAWALNTAEKILFVRDTSKTDAPYYIAVFELTRAQAAALGWTTGADANSAVAFGAFESTEKHPLNRPLAYPTTAQWAAYVEETPSRPCNVRYGISAGADARPPTDWLVEGIQTGTTAQNSYGLYDTFGNVAECVIDAGTATFRGWYAETTDRFQYITRDGEDYIQTLAQVQANDGYSTGVAGVRPIYLPPAEQTYTVTVTLDGKTISTQTDLVPGAAVTVTPPTPEIGYVLVDGYTVLPDSITNTSFTMPMADVTFAFTSKAQATIAVEGGSASPSTVCTGDTFTLSAEDVDAFLYWEGEGITDENKTQNPLTLTAGTITAGETLTYKATFKPVVTITVIGGTASPTRVVDGGNFTLTATGNAWQQFKYWEGNYGLTDLNRSRNPLTLTCEDQATGTTLTYTAVFETQPRVMVFGGTATPEEASDDLGEGYYPIGTKLTLAPYTSTPAGYGYTFSHWKTSAGETITDATYIVRSGDNITIEAVYKADENVTNSEIIYVGAVSDTELTPRTAMGYTANLTAISTVYTGNTFKYYGATEALSDYAKLDFATKTIDLSLLAVSGLTANSEENRQTALILKRFKPTSGQPYYIGTHELTEAQYDNLYGEETPSTSLYPYVTEQHTRAKATEVLQKLSETFGETFTKPTYQQIANISTGAQNAAQTYGDAKITEAMVNCETDQAGLLPSGSCTVDPYGYYDLWGNAAESFAGDDTYLWGGSCWVAFNYCNLASASKEEATINRPGAIRAAIAVPEQYIVTVSNLEHDGFKVFKNQTITLKPQVAPGRKFTGWTITTGTVTNTITALPEIITITEDTTLTATFSAPLEMVTLDYEDGYIGPASILPGTTFSVYAETPGQPIPTLSVTPSSAATVDPTTGHITLNATATGTVTIRATHQAVAPGFQFKLR